MNGGCVHVIDAQEVVATASHFLVPASACNSGH